jgi:dihydroorotase
MRAISAAQPYDLVLRGGHVIDPANGIDGVMDVAVSGGRIAAVRAGIGAAEARRAVDCKGFYVVPGLVDLHVHVFGYAGSLDPDDTSLVTGATTVVDAGSSGWRTFEEFERGVMKRSHTRVLAWINIVGAGMVGEPAESNTADMEPAKTAETIGRHRESIVGVKTAHFTGHGYTAIDRAVEAGRLAHVPIMVDDRIFSTSGRNSRDELLEHLRPGDIHTHLYNDRQIELTDRFTGKVQPYMFEARRRGVLFDLGHGAGSFLWPVATKAMAQGFAPDTISTDLHATSILGPKSDMPNCMSKMMLLGMSLRDVVERATVNPAKEIGRYPEAGTLGVGRSADVAVLELESGVFAFQDSWGAKRLGTKRLRNVMTIRTGEVAYDPEGRSLPVWRTSGSGGKAREPGAIYDVLLRNGEVIDPANHRAGRMDVAIAGGRIARVATELAAANARVAIDVSRYYVTPGLIEPAARSKADYDSLPYGVTTAVLAPPASISFAGAAPETIPPAGMSAWLNLGLSIGQIVERTTVNPARVLGRTDVGTLREGGAADVAVFALEHGRFGFVDAEQRRLVGDRRLRCAMTIRHGEILWDADGLSATDWERAGPYSNYK